MTTKIFHNLNKKISSIIIITISFLFISSTMSIGEQTSPLNISENTTTLIEGYENINVTQAWELLSTTANGIQIPIDVRYDHEWIDQKINTPSPEHPRHHCLCAWEDETVVQEFIDEFEGETLIIYCKGGFRSQTAAQILVDHQFQGTLYNMLGGITAWNASGLPTKGNEAPQKPTITGPSWMWINREKDFTISANDPDFDDIYYYINFSDNSPTLYLGPYASGEEITINHSWEQSGVYFIQAQATDIYQKDSEFNFYQIQIGLTKPSRNILLEIISQLLSHNWFLNPF
jgi:rhodanese-related sulfurtransferase